MAGLEDYIGEDGFDDRDVFETEKKFLEWANEEYVRAGIDVSDRTLEEAEAEHEAKDKPEPAEPSVPRIDLLSTPEGRKIAKKAAQDATTVVIGIMNSLASTIAGKEAKMTAEEKDMIKQPLERLFMRMNFFSSDAVSKFGDPLALMIGITAWGSRVYTIYRENKELEREARMERYTSPDSAKRQKGAKDKRPNEGDDAYIAMQMAAPDYISKQIGGA